MAINFPNSPSLNQVYTDSTSGFSFKWNGTVWQSYSPTTTNFIPTVLYVIGRNSTITLDFPLIVYGRSVNTEIPGVTTTTTSTTTTTTTAQINDLDLALFD